MQFAFISLPIEYYSPVSGGAISTIIAETAAPLIELGHTVRVLAPPPPDGDPVHVVGQFVPLRFTRREDMGAIQGKFSGLRRRLAGWDWPGYESYLSAVLAETDRRFGDDVLVVFNDLVTPKYLRRARPEVTILSWLQNEWRTAQRSILPVVRATDRFLTCSKYIAEWTGGTYGIAREKFAVVHSGVNLSVFGPSGTEKPESSGASGLRVLFVGRLDPNKGPDIAARAVKTLQDEGLNVTFTVAGAKWFYGGGDDEYTLSLKRLLEETQSRYLGHVPRGGIADVYRGADVVCVLSRSQEPFGLVSLEAMASGCAVLSSDRGGLPEACGGAAILVNPDSQLAVEQALRSLATDRSMLADYKARSLARAAGATWRSVAEQVVSVVRSGGRADRRDNAT